MAAFVPDFDSAIGGWSPLASCHTAVVLIYGLLRVCGIGIAAIFGLAETYDTTTGVINNLTSK